MVTITGSWVLIRGRARAILRHPTTAAAADLRRLAPASSPERCIEAAFRFLLDHEPKGAILRRFDLSVIARYFPEFERELPRRLAEPSATGAL